MKLDSEQKERFLKMVSKADSLECYEYDGKRARPFISLYLFKQDITEILAWVDCVISLSQIKGIHPSAISVFWEKIITTYAKNFTRSYDKFSKMEIAKYSKDADDLVLHEQIMKVRNTYVAHREKNDFEYHTVLVALVGTEDNCNMEISVPTLKLLGHYFEPVKMQKYLKKLFKKVDYQLKIKRDGLERFFFDELQLEVNFD